MTFDKEKVAYTDLVHPHRIVTLANAIGGALIFLMALVSTFTAITIASAFTPALSVGLSRGIEFLFPVLERQFGLGLRTPETEFVQLYMVVAAFIIYAAVYVRFAFQAGGLGLMHMLRALIQWRTTGTPEGVPEDLHEQSSVLEKMLRRERYWNHITDAKMIALFSLNVQRMSPVAAAIAKTVWPPLSTWLHQFSRAAVSAAALTVLLLWVHALDPSATGVAAPIVALVRSMGLGPGLEQILSPYVTLAILVISLRALDFTLITMMVPRRDWPIDSVTKGDRAMASTSPYLVSEEFPVRMESYRLSEKPNRVWRHTGEVAATSISDTGHFVQIGLIEQQPQSIKNPNETGALVRLISGWSLIIIGLGILLFFLMPYTLRSAIETNRLPPTIFTLMPITQLIYVVVGKRALLEGRRMVRQAEELFEAYWFASPAVAFQLTGTTSRSEVKIGRGRSDSIETSSTVYRAEFLYDLTSAMLLSEATKINGRRDVVGMWNARESGTLLNGAIREMREIIDRRAAPINVDLSGPGLRDHLEANAVIDAMRARQKEAIRREARVEPPPKPKPIAPRKT